VKRTLATLLTLSLLLSVVAQVPPPQPIPPAEEETTARRDAALQEALEAAAAANPPGVGATPPRLAPNAPSSTELSSAEDIIEKGTIKIPGAELDLVLQIYANLVERTILRPSNLPATTITLETQTDLTKAEAIQALDAVLALNGISMINVGKKFVKAVPASEAGSAGAPVESVGSDELPELGQYVSHVVQLRNVQASEVIPALQPFAKIQNSVLAIESSNILILRDFAENVKRMLEMIERIDVVVESNFVSEVIPIKYALAADIANALNALSSGGGGTSVGSSMAGRASASATSRTRASATPNPYSPQQQRLNQRTGATTQQQQPATGGSFTDRLRSIINRNTVSGDLEILGQTRIIADERTNSLLIFASRQDMEMIKDVVSKLDVVLAQVLIEALVIEVSLDDNFDYGISYLQTGQEFGGNWTGAGGVFNNVNLINPDTISAATNLVGGFSYYAQYQDDFLVAVTAAASDDRVSVLQRPRVQTSHAVEATLFVGETRPYPTGSSFGGVYGGYSSIQQLNIGVTLTVLPLINPDGLVVMDIAQLVESFGGNVTIQNVGEVPVTRRREANAKVAVKTGDTIVLGGFISADKSRNESGVPFLKDIPGLGILFRAQSESNARRELMIFIRPTVLETPEIAARVAMEEKDKMPGILGAEAELTRDYEEAMREVSKEAGIDYVPPDEVDEEGNPYRAW
jgi:general secretion pathway protein D